MAENETLDLGKTPRWLKVGHAVKRGKPLEEIVQEAIRSLYQTVRAVMKLIPFDQFLAARCDNPAKLHELIRNCKKGHQYAQLFRDEAEPGLSRQAFLENYLCQIPERFLDQIRVWAMGTKDELTAPNLRQQLDAVQEQLAVHIRHIAEKLAEDATKPPRMPRVKKASSQEDRTVAILSESMLGVNPQ